MSCFREARSVVIVLFTLLEGTSTAQGRHPLRFDDLMAFQRVADPQISPDGSWVSYSVTRYSKEKNSGDSDVWIAPITGSGARPLTQSEKRDNNARWSPDGKRIAFISARDGKPQVWVIAVSGGEARQVTRMANGADGVIWSPDGKNLAFTSDVFPDCSDDACNKKRLEEAEKSKVKAKVIDRLLYRHWDSWKDGLRTHIFVVPAEGGTPIDLTPGDFDAPPFSLGGPTDYDFSPDGRELCFARNADKVEAASTNVDLWTVPSGGGAAVRITTNPAYDGSPLYSPDGRYVAYRAQKRPGFESDRFELMLYDRKNRTSKTITPSFDRSVGSLAWSPDSRALYLAAEDEGYSVLFRVAVDGGTPQRLTGKTNSDDLEVSPDGKTLVFTRQSLSRPVEVYRADASGRNESALTKHNDALMTGIEMGVVEDVRYKGAAGADVQAWLVKPPGFEPSRRWPAIVLVHGGPQGAWNDAFSYRWNLQMLAARGYVVFAPNPRGSTGFGQRFTDDISGDWGGKVYEDLMKGVDYLSDLPFVDGNRLAAAGASYGGYMMNWILGHSDRFRCLVSHAGVFNLSSMYGSTEELWFPEWEFKGTPWTNPEQYARWSPSNFVKNFKTPTLVTHGELDYRVPISEGLQLFTSLQRMNVPSKFLYFPDEGHWILKPQNSELWHTTVLDWIDKFTGEPQRP